MKRLLTIAVALLTLGACSIEGMLWGIGESIVAGAGRAALEAHLIGPADTMLRTMESAETGPLNARDAKVVEAKLTEYVDRLSNQFRKMERDKGSMKDTPVRAKLPAVKVRLMTDPKGRCLFTDNVGDPTIFVCQGFLAQFSGKLKEAEPLLEDADPSDGEGLLGAFDGWAAGMFADMVRQGEAVVLQEVVYFALAHELTHVWLDQPGVVSKENEVRADAYAIFASAEVSAVQKRRAELQARFMKTLSFNGAPIEFFIMTSELGPEALLTAYNDFCLENACKEDTETYIPMQERMTKVTAEVEAIVQKRVDAQSDFEIGADYILTSIRDTLLGFGGGSDDDDF